MHNTDTFSGASFSLKNRAARAIWNLVAFIFFRYSPKPFHSWRAFLLRCFGAKIGKAVHIYPKVKIWAPWNLECGSQSGIADKSIIYSQGKIIIGKRVVISQGTHLVTGTHDYTKVGFPLVTRKIIINDNAWLAAEVFVHPGVTIGEGCVIGARSVVVKDMPEWMVCSGHPCIPLKKRILSTSYTQVSTRHDFSTDSH